MYLKYAKNMLQTQKELGVSFTHVKGLGIKKADGHLMGFAKHKPNQARALSLEKRLGQVGFFFSHCPSACTSYSRARPN
jgi:hypothetical protein